MTEWSRTPRYRRLGTLYMPVAEEATGIRSGKFLEGGQ